MYIITCKFYLTEEFYGRWVHKDVLQLLLNYICPSSDHVTILIQVNTRERIFTRTYLRCL